MSYRHLLRVRYGETDQMGVVHHANYLLYLEEARTAYMASLGCPYSEVERSGIGLPVRRADLRYRAPAAYEDELAVGVRLGRVGGASVTFEYEIHRPADGRHLMSGTVELACISLAAPGDGPVMLPERLRRVLNEAARQAAPSGS